MLPHALASIALCAWAAPEIRLERWPDGTPRAEYEVRVEPDGREVRHGSWKSWHENGKEHEQGAYADGLAVGEWLVRWPNGKRRSEGRFVDGLREGPWKEFHEKGPKAAEGSYKSDRRTGAWEFWTEERQPDAARSGVYDFARRPVGDFGVWAKGPTLDKKPVDLWVWVRADGSLRLAGRLGPRGPEGPWAAAFADGSLDLEQQSGEFTSGKRMGALAGWPEGVDELPRDLAPDPRRAAPLSVDAAAAAKLEAWLAAEDGAREGPWRDLAATPRAAFVACVAHLQGVDYAAPDERARRVANDALPLLIGVAFPIEQGTAVERARRALEWRDHVELSDLDDKHWRALFDASLRKGPLELAHTPLGGRAMPASWLPPPFGPGIGGGAGGSKARFSAGGRVKARGGSGTEPAVEAGFGWLVRAQAADGSWERNTPRTLEATAWALLALGGTGLDAQDPGTTNEALRKGLTWLMAQQRTETGRYATPLCYELRSHALSVWAAAEHSVMQSWPALDASLARAVAALLAEQLPDGAFPRDVGAKVADPFATVYAAVALTALESKGSQEAREPRRRALEALAARTGADGALPEPETRSPAVTAASAFLRLVCGLDPGRDDVLGRHVAWMVANPSNIEPRHPRLDAEYLMFGAWASIQVGGPVWDAWNSNMKTQLLQVQRRDGALAGSWETLGIGPMDVTTVTAQRVMTFQAYYRYDLREN